VSAVVRQRVAAGGQLASRDHWPVIQALRLLDSTSP
jgi:hypothetical protein